MPACPQFKVKEDEGLVFLSVARQRVGCAAAYVLAAVGGKLQPSGGRELCVQAWVEITALPTSQR